MELNLSSNAELLKRLSKKLKRILQKTILLQNKYLV